eukprot:817166-Pyramimonas_sp.AAC.2
MRFASKLIGQAVPIQNLTLTMFRADDKPIKMKTKAAESRYLLQVLREMLVRFYPPQSDRDRLRFSCVDYLYRLYEELKGWDGQSAENIKDWGIRHAMLYSQFFREAARRDPRTPLWRMVPKHHLFVHLLEKQTPEQGNPREGWNYGDEDEIGTAVELASAGHCNTLVLELVRKYRCLYLADALAEIRAHLN